MHDRLAAAGAIFGSILSHTFKNISHEIMERRLAPRENMRAGAVYSYALAKIDEHINANKTFRNDNLVKEDSDNRSAAEEILEGILLHGQRK